MTHGPDCAGLAGGGSSCSRLPAQACGARQPGCLPGPCSPGTALCSCKGWLQPGHCGLYVRSADGFSLTPLSATCLTVVSVPNTLHSPLGHVLGCAVSDHQVRVQAALAKMLEAFSVAFKKLLGILTALKLPTTTREKPRPVLA